MKRQVSSVTPPGVDSISVTGSSCSLVITLEGAELVISTTSGGFSYTIEEVDSSSERTILASGTVDLNVRGKLLIAAVLRLFKLSGPLRAGKFEARVVDDYETK